MEIPKFIVYDFRAYLEDPLGEWKKISKDPKEHLTPVGVLCATTLLVVAVSGRYFAIGFVCLSTLSYPFLSKQIVYFMSLDLHEDVKSLSMVALYILAMKAQTAAILILPIFLTLVYSNRNQWATQRALVTSQGNEIQQLKGQITALEVTAQGYEKELINLEKSLTAVLDKLSIGKEQATAQTEVIAHFSSINDRVNSVFITLFEDIQKSNTQLEELKKTKQGQLFQQVIELEKKFAENQALLDTCRETIKRLQDKIASGIEAETRMQQRRSGTPVGTPKKPDTPTKQ